MVGLLDAVLGRSWRGLGPVLGGLEWSWGGLWRSWDGLGAVLGRLGVVLGPSWGGLGGVGSFWCGLGPS